MVELRRETYQRVGMGALLFLSSPILTLVLYIVYIDYHSMFRTRRISRKKLLGYVTDHTGRLFGWLTQAVADLTYLVLMVAHFALYIFLLPQQVLLAVFLLLLEWVYNVIYQSATTCPFCLTKHKIPVVLCQCRIHHPTNKSWKRLLFTRCDCGKLISISPFSNRRRHESRCLACRSAIQTTDCVLHTALLYSVDVALEGFELERVDVAAPSFNKRDNWSFVLKGKQPLLPFCPTFAIHYIHLPQSRCKTAALVKQSPLLEKSTAVLYLVDPLALEEYTEKMEVAKSYAAPAHLWKYTDTLLRAVENADASKSDKVIAVALVRTNEISPLDPLIEGLAQKRPTNELCVDFLNRFGQAGFVQLVTTNFKKSNFFVISDQGDNLRDITKWFVQKLRRIKP